MNGKAIGNKTLVITHNEFSVSELRIGPDPRGPAKCIRCHQAFKVGEEWRRMKSPPDPDYAAYCIGVHARCLAHKSK